MPEMTENFDDFFNNYKISRENQHFYINHAEIVGLQGVQAETNTPLSPVFHLGLEKTSTVLRGQTVGTLNVQSLLVNSDSFIGFTGLAPATGHLLISEALETPSNGLIFNPIYLSSYTLKYSDDQIPETGATFLGYESFGIMDITELEDVPNWVGGVPIYDLLIPNRGSITLSFDEFTTNRLTSFELGISLNRNAIYKMGNWTPFRVDTTPPHSVVFSCQMEIGSYQMRNLRDTFEGKTIKDLTIECKDYKTDALIHTYNLDSLELISTSHSSSVGDNTVVNLQFRGYVDF